MSELPTSVGEIEAIKKETIVSESFEVTFFGKNFAVIVGTVLGTKNEATPDGFQIARVLEALRQGGYRIRDWNYALYFGNIQCVVVEYDFPRFRGEEEV